MKSKVIIYALALILFLPNCFFGKTIKTGDKSDKLLTQGKMLINEEKWIEAKETIEKSFNIKNTAIAAYLLSMISYKLNDIEDTGYYADLSLGITPALPKNLATYSRKYLKWSNLKSKQKIRTSSFEFSDETTSPKDLEKIGALKEEQNKITDELLILKNELGDQAVDPYEHETTENHFQYGL